MTCALTTLRGADNPHTGHSCQRSARVLGTAAPHTHTWLVPRGSTFTISRPALAALYESLAKKEFHPASWTGPANTARKSFDVEVFHRDKPVAFHQPAAEMMMKGGTLVSDFTVRLGHQYGGLAAATAAALATGKPALGAAEVCQPALEMSRIVDLPAIRKSDKTVHPDIQADLLGRLRQRDGVPLDGKTHVPVVYVPLDRNCFDLALHRPVQLDLDQTGALDTQLAVIEQSAAIAVGGKGDAVVPPERTEAREAGFLAASYPSEERLEGLIQPAQHILTAGEVGQSDQPFGPHGLQLVGLVVVVDALAAHFPGVAPFLKGGVVEVASLVELVLEKLNLGFRQVEAVSVGEAHLPSFLALDRFAHHSFAHRADGASVTAAAPESRQTRAQKRRTRSARQEYTRTTGLRQTKSEDTHYAEKPHSPVA